MTIITGIDSTFIETLNGESEEDWRRAVEQMLSAIADRPNWWHPFGIGPTVEWSGRKFRSFRCVAGSVSGWLMLTARKGELPRALMVTGVRHTDNTPVAHVWIAGVEQTAYASPILAQLPAASIQQPSCAGPVKRILRCIFRFSGLTD